nr:hypothetical protein [Spirochaeta sp.]
AVQYTDAPGAAPVFSEEPQITRNSRTVPAESEIEVRLPGVSWLFLGSEPPVTFLGRETDPDADETLFRFRVPGAAHLRFEAQDLATGARTRHEETVRVAADEPAVETAGIATSRRDGATRSGQAAETPRDSNNDAADELSYLEYLGDPEHSFAPDHHASIVAATANDDDALRDVSLDDLLSYADRVLDQGNPAAARNVLQAMWASRRMKSDEVLYRLAQLAETAGPTRDLRRARELYSELVDSYPFSVHYRDSEERIRFLNRHFFHIR